MEETKKCPFCGEEILATAKKCKHCGEWVEKRKIHCPICQEEIDEDIEICPYCHEKVQGQPSQTTTNTSNSDSLRRCPYCGETILSTAKKCKHCGEWLDSNTNPKISSPTSNATALLPPTLPWGYGWYRFFSIMAIIFSLSVFTYTGGSLILVLIDIFLFVSLNYYLHTFKENTYSFTPLVILYAIEGVLLIIIGNEEPDWDSLTMTMNDESLVFLFLILLVVGIIAIVYMYKAGNAFIKLGEFPLGNAFKIYSIAGTIVSTISSLFESGSTGFYLFSAMLFGLNVYYYITLHNFFNDKRKRLLYPIR